MPLGKIKSHLSENDDVCMSLPSVARGRSSPISFASVKSGLASGPSVAIGENYSPGVLNYDVNIVKTSVYSTANASDKAHMKIGDAAKKNKKSSGGSRKSSDFMLDEYIDDYRLDDEINDSSLSSNEDVDDEDEYFEDDEVRRSGDVIIRKLKEAEKEREKLAHENAKIKQQLETANAQISSLRHEMSSFRKDTISFILNQMDTLHLKNKNSDV